MSKEPELFFKPGGESKKGIPDALSSRRGKTFEFQIRELLQNAMDACINQEKPCTVCFSMEKLSPSDIPGRSGYEAALKGARKLWEGDSDREEYVKVIQQRWDSGQAFNVFCVSDNGIGMGPKQMKAILQESTPQKGKGASGSKGVGHLAAFLLSGLNYLFYAAVFHQGNQVVRHAAGHALLISQKNTEDQISAPNGYYLPKPPDFNDDVTPFTFLPEGGIPGFLSRHLPQKDQTGSVCAILDLDLTKLDGGKEMVIEGVAKEIRKAALRSFLVALFQEDLQIEVRLPDQEEFKMSKQNLLLDLQAFQADKGISDRDKIFYMDLHRLLLKNDADIGGEESALGSRRDFRSGRLEAPFSDCRIYLDLKPQGSTNAISVWRNGMLITSNEGSSATGTDAFGQQRFFGDRKPFHALVSLSGKGEEQENRTSHDLIRRAETQHHDKISGSELFKQCDKDRLSRWRKAVREWIRDNTPEPTDVEDLEEIPLEGEGGGFIPLDPFSPRTLQKGEGAGREGERRNCPHPPQPGPDPNVVSRMVQRPSREIPYRIQGMREGKKDLLLVFVLYEIIERKKRQSDSLLLEITYHTGADPSCERGRSSTSRRLRLKEASLMDGPKGVACSLANGLVKISGMSPQNKVCLLLETTEGLSLPGNTNLPNLSVSVSYEKAPP